MIFSYGITNSGKTFTILGEPELPGILPTLILKLSKTFSHEIRVVATELYKNEFWSLDKKGSKLTPKEVKGTISFEDCESILINETNMREHFEKFIQNRSCSSTNYNNVSSRSHAIFKLWCGPFKVAVVDLAGSERTSKNADRTVDLKETVFINGSLLTLKKCIKALEEKSTGTNISQKTTVPYRESPLTQCIVDHFISTGRIFIIQNVNPEKNCLEQNLNSMEYTSKAKNISANATSDFSKMLKSTAKKKNEVSVIKVKNFLTQSASHPPVSSEVKSHSFHFPQTEQKYIITEESLEVEDHEASFEQEI